MKFLKIYFVNVDKYKEAFPIFFDKFLINYGKNLKLNFFGSSMNFAKIKEKISKKIFSKLWKKKKISFWNLSLKMKFIKIESIEKPEFQWKTHDFNFFRISNFQEKNQNQNPQKSWNLQIFRTFRISGILDFQNSQNHRIFYLQNPHRFLEKSNLQKISKVL